MLLLLFLKLFSVFLWAAVAFLIWNILIRSLLMEKVFSFFGFSFLVIFKWFRVFVFSYFIIIYWRYFCIVFICCNDYQSGFY